MRWLVDSLPVEFAVTDRSNRYRFFNASAIANLSRPISEVLGRHPTELFPANDAQRISEANSRVMRTGATERSELPIVRGQQRYIYEVCKAPLRDPTGAVHGVISVGRDITSLREAERELGNSQRRFATLIELLPIGVIELSSEHEVVLANREARRIFGASEIIGRTAQSRAGEVFEADGSPRTPDDLPGVRCIAERKPQPQQLLRLRRPDGTSVWTLCSATPLFDDDHVTGALVVFHDIAERKLAEDRAEQARALSEQIFHILADQSSDAIYRTDAEGHCIYINARGLELYGMTLEQVRGTGWVSALHPDDRERVSQWWQHAVAHREGCRDVHCRFVDPRGRVTWVQGSANPIITADGTLHGYIGIDKDVTALHQAKQRESTMVEELNHRVKNAMATVIGLAAATARNSQTVAEFMATFTGRIQSMARLHEALARGNWVDLSLAQLIDNALGGAGVDVHVDGPPVTISARVAMPLGQALFELHANAVRHGSLAQPNGRLAVHWVMASDDRVRLHWTETTGDPITKQPHLGVGLTLLRGLIEQEIGGTLELRFEPTGLRAQLEFPP
jgi:PAS domain S-box-containing protein